MGFRFTQKNCYGHIWCAFLFHIFCVSLFCLVVLRSYGCRSDQQSLLFPQVWELFISFCGWYEVWKIRNSFKFSVSTLQQDQNLTTTLVKTHCSELWMDKYWHCCCSKFLLFAFLTISCTVWLSSGSSFCELMSVKQCTLNLYVVNMRI